MYTKAAMLRCSENSQHNQQVSKPDVVSFMCRMRHVSMSGLSAAFEHLHRVHGTKQSGLTIQEVVATEAVSRYLQTLGLNICISNHPTCRVETENGPSSQAGYRADVPQKL